LAGLLLLAVVAALQILAASSDSWALRLSPAANAWSASFIAVGSVWLAYDVLWKHSRGFRWLGIALFLVAVPVVGYLGAKLARSSAGSPPGIRARTLASLPAVLAVLAAAI